MRNREARQDAIVQALARDGRVDVASLTENFGVTTMTIRRDLAELESQGLAHRVHGGARKRERSPFERRISDFHAEKARIGRAAASLVKPGETVAIDSGTTAAAVAHALRDRSGLQIITNSVHVAAEFHGTPNSVILLGGRLLPEMSTVGPLALQTLDGLSANKLFLGCGGVTERHGFTYFDLEETAIRKALLRISDELIVVADHRKFGKTETLSLTGLASASTVVTDEMPASSYAELFQQAGVKLVVAEEPDSGSPHA
jgi:DeoR/GlpR family transcriptional regulator of sugar metabolism